MLGCCTGGAIGSLGSEADLHVTLRGNRRLVLLRRLQRRLHEYGHPLSSLVVVAPFEILSPEVCERWGKLRQEYCDFGRCSFAGTALSQLLLCYEQEFEELRSNLSTPSAINGCCIVVGRKNPFDKEARRVTDPDLLRPCHGVTCNGTKIKYGSLTMAERVAFASGVVCTFSRAGM